MTFWTYFQRHLVWTWLLLCRWCHKMKANPNQNHILCLTERGFRCRFYKHMCLCRGVCKICLNMACKKEKKVFVCNYLLTYFSPVCLLVLYTYFSVPFSWVTWYSIGVKRSRSSALSTIIFGDVSGFIGMLMIWNKKKNVFYHYNFIIV